MRPLDAVELATLEWADWFNQRRLLEPIGNIPPADADFTTRGQRSFFGFKAYVAVDLGSDLTRDAVPTGAVGDAASPPRAGAARRGGGVCGNGYGSAARRGALAEAGIVEVTIHCGQARPALLNFNSAPWRCAAKAWLVRAGRAPLPR